MRASSSVLLVIGLVICYGQEENDAQTETLFESNIKYLSERIGNCSIELLYHTSKLLPEGQNMILSPFTVWTALAVISKGALGMTRREIRNALRLPQSNSLEDDYLKNFRELTQLLQVNTTTEELTKFNGIFVDTQRFLLPDFQDLARNNFDTYIVTLNFTDSENSAKLLNTVISNFTHGRIPKLVESSYFNNAMMFLTSALYFKGQWAVPFNSTLTKKRPFYDNSGNQIGEVNMMYNRHTYPFSNERTLKARVIELPYGDENRLSMIVMLPNPGVSLEDMIKNFLHVPLDLLFEELRISKEEYSDDEVDCYIPRFKFESSIDLTEVLKNYMGINDLFDMTKARLPIMARTPLYVSKVIHKAEIEVTEEGTAAIAANTFEFTSRVGIARFVANRPFTYMIIEKVTNTIIFGGIYKEPSLY